MAKFTDRLGRDWCVDILVMHLPILRKEFGIDMKSKDWPNKLNDLVASNDEEFVRLLGVLCDEQVKAASLTPEQFIGGFDVRTLNDAGTALEEAFTDFSPVLRANPTARQKVREKAAILRERIDRRTAEAIELEADSQIETAMEKLESTLRKSAGDSPDSSGSTQAG